MKKYNSAAFLLLCTVFVLSCATSPKVGPAQIDGAPDFSVLPPGANVYLWADVDQSKPLLQALSFNGMSGRDASQILDRTNTAVAAFYPANTEGSSASRRFFLAGWGKYPIFGAGISMGFSKDWKQIKSPGGSRYWYNKNLNLGTAMGSRIAFVSDGDPFAQGAGINPVPQGFEEFRKGTAGSPPCVLAGWHNDAESQIGRILDTMGVPLRVPVEGLFFGFVRSPEESGQAAMYETQIRMKTPSPSQAGALVSLLTIARMFMGGGTDFVSLLLSNAPVQDGADMLLRLPPMGAEEIAGLFTALSAYSP